MGMNALEVRRRVMLAQPHEAKAVGAIASFRTDVLSPLKMEFDLLPIQDLHGQANPYPPGGGINLLNPGVSEEISGITKTVNADGTIRFKGTASATVDFYFNGTTSSGTTLNLPDGTYKLYGAEDGVTNSTFMFFCIYVKNGQTYYANGKDHSTIDLNGTVTARIFVRVYNGANIDVTLKLSLVKGTQTAWSPYSNICPITGHDGFTRIRTGKNLLAKPLVYYSNIDRTLSDCFFIKAGTYTLSVSSFTGATSWRYAVMLKDAQGNNLSDSAYCPVNRFTWNTTNKYWLGQSNITNTSIKVTIVEDCFVRFLFALGDTSGTTVANDAMLNTGTPAKVYEPYSGVSKSTTFPDPPGTVYGGHVTDNGDGTGTLTVNTAIYTLDGTNNAVNAMSDSGTYKFFSKTNLIVPAPNTTASNDPPTLWCDTFKAKGVGGLGTAYISGGYFRICADSSFASVEAFNTWLQSNNVTFIYKLNSPVTYTLPLTALQSLIGLNHIWVDNADSVSVEYWGH